MRLPPPGTPQPRYAETEWFIGDRGHEYGDIEGVPVPVPHSFVLSADIAAGGGSGGVELYGTTRANAASLIARMPDGDPVTIVPQLASLKVRKRFPVLRGLRFFDTYLSANAGPEVVTALNTAGHVLGHCDSERGLFC